MKRLSRFCSVPLGFVAIICLAGAFRPPSAVCADSRNRPPETKVQLTGKEARHYFDETGSGQSLTQALTAARFGITWQERALSGDEPGVYVASNDKQNFSASFAPDRGGRMCAQTVNTNGR